MTLHKTPEHNTPAVIEGLKLHGLPHDAPSQLADAFRLGFAYADRAQRAAPVSNAHSYDDLWNALQRIENSAVSLPQFRVLHEGGLDACVANITAAMVPVSDAKPVADGSTPGRWWVRKHERDGELKDCFICAPDVNGYAYDACPLQDDEYRGTEEDPEAGIKRKLADCELVVKAVNAYRATAQPVEVQRVGLTDAEVDDLHADANRGFNIEREDYFKAFRDAERAHGIKPAGEKGSAA